MKHNRNRLRWAWIAAGGILAVCLLAVAALWFLLPDEGGDRTQSDPSYTFYPIYDGDVRENDYYLGLDRQLYWCEPNYGAKTALDETDISADPRLQVLAAYIESLIDGYPSACRALFTEAALASSPIPNFAQQMIYRVEITEKDSRVSDGVTHVTYSLAYMICQNNGTYRTDVGSNAVRPEYLTLVEQPDGSYLIESLVR